MITGTEPGARGRFGELVKLHVEGRRFLDSTDERRLLEEGVTRYGLSLDEARGVLRTAAEHGEVALDRELARSTELLLKTLADPQGRVSRPDFAKVAAFWRARSGGAVTPAEADRRVKRLMEEQGLVARRSGALVPSRRWYRAIEG